MADVDMQVALGEGTRRLPVYLLLDCSGSMAGAPIEAVRRGVELFAEEVRQDTFARDSVYVGVITFDNDARLVTPGLVGVEQFHAPAIEAKGQTKLGRALAVLQQSLDADVRPSVKGGEKGDWKPIVFILTDGEPTDEWEEPRQKILDRAQQKVVNVVTVGCGPGLNETMLKKIAIGPTFRMDNSEASFKAFFQWVTQSVRHASKVYSQPGAQNQPAAVAPPSPAVIQFVP